MKPAPFAYSRPASLDEALRLLSEGHGNARPLAGGQSLVPMLNLRLAPAERIVDLGRLPELRRVEDLGPSVRYGAMTPHAAFEDDEVPDASNGLMRHVAERFAFRAVRNRGTIGGALALADPAADWLPAVIALAARLHIVGPAGRRSVPASEFVLGPYTTALRDDELLEAIEVPRRAADERWGYSKVTTKVGEYAESLAIAVLAPGRGFARAVLGGTDGAPILVERAAAAVLAGEPADGMRGAIRDELLATGRAFTPAKLTMHTTTLQRALKDAAPR